MKVLGVFGGIGSMMIGAKKQGYQVIGNIEDRKYFFTGTFEYKSAVTTRMLDVIKNFDAVDASKVCGSVCPRSTT